MLTLDEAAYYRVLQARDRRFDGRVFVGVRTTGVFCRPVCPARTPKRESCRFFASAAAAQEAGFRPCLRCRPERSPDFAFAGTASTVSRAIALIGEGALDGEEASVVALAERLGMGERQLRRLFDEHLGASPTAVAVSRRVLFAKQLVQETRLPMVEVALASGFGSVRRFNDAFQKLYGRPPRALRRFRDDRAARGRATPVTLRLGYRPPYDWESLLGFLSARAIAGVEEIEDAVYRRVISVDGRAGFLEVRHLPAAASLEASILVADVRSLPAVVERLRRLFDLSADVDAITAHFRDDPLLGPLVAERPGLRVPGAWDGFELAVRAVLGQQISVSAARTLAGRLVAEFGVRLDSERLPGTLARAFPGPRELAEADLERIGLTRARAATLRSLAKAAECDAALFQPAASHEEAVTRFIALPGIGAWTAEYIALRALREADAFPATDVGLLRGASNGARLDPGALARLAERFRPFRAYAAQHLWTHDAARAGITQPQESPHATSRRTFPRRHARNGDRRPQTRL